MPPTIAVTLVTFDSADFLARCLDALAAQTAPPSEVVVVDNASRDDSLAIARRHPVVSRVIANTANVGFAAGQNQAIASSAGEWVLTLNPDVVLDAAFLATLAPRAAQPHPLGTLCGKLLRLGPDGRPVSPARLDSTGIEFTRSFRHLDRGSEEPDDGRYAD